MYIISPKENIRLAAEILRSPTFRAEENVEYDHAVKLAAIEELKRILDRDAPIQRIAFWALEKAEKVKDENGNIGHEITVADVPFEGYEDFQLRKYTAVVTKYNTSVNIILNAMDHHAYIRPSKLFVFFDHNESVFHPSVAEALGQRSNERPNTLVVNGIML